MGALVAAFFAFDLGHFFTLDYFKSQQAAINDYYAANPLATAAIFFAAYVAVTGLSLPGATIMTLAAGAIFGLLWGTVIVSFASSLGATLAFLTSRFVLRDSIQSKFGDKLAAINAGIAKDGPFYLFTLRLVPAFPFFVINLVMGLTPLRTRTFYWVSQLGMLAGTIVYVYAGTEIAKIESLRGILSPGLILSFTLLGIFPLVAKWIVNAVEVAQGLREMDEARAFRPQRGRDRRRFGRSRHRLHRGRGQSQSHADRKAQDGRRLPEHRLRAVQGADPLGEVSFARAPRARTGHAIRRRGFRFRGRDGARAARGENRRAARLDRALQQARCRLRDGRSENHVAVDGGSKNRGRHAHAHHQEHRDCGGRAAVHPADSADCGKSIR